jgi:ankyrin repeat protein
METDLNKVLFQVLKDNDMKAVMEALEKDADVNAKDEYGKTALMLASEYGNLDIVKQLIAKGAYINAKDNEGKTALMYSLKKEI